MTIRRLIPLVPGAVALAVFAALAAFAADKPATSEDFAYSTYREQAGSITVLVDSYPAALHAGDRYFPLMVAVGLQSKGKSISVTPESFTLVDREGKAYPAVPFEQFAANYPKREFDATLIRKHPLVIGEQFATSLQVPGRFYPSLSSAATRIERVELAPFTWFHSLVYFPRPASGLGGVLTLRLSGGGVEPPVEVRFEVPRLSGQERAATD